MTNTATIAPAFTVTEDNGLRFIEGIPTARILHTAEDGAILEACFSSGVRAALLYPANMTEHFFDLSSREAGIVLQKLRTYGVRLALVCTPGSVTFSTRFPEMASEEARSGHFNIFASRAEAIAWLHN